MRFIKTYWHGLEGELDDDYYLNIKKQPIYNFALSSLFLLNHHSVELYTDAAGENIISHFEIPFTKFHIVDKISNRYKSINDLYVMSLQNGPVALIDDNVLVMDTINIHVDKSKMIVL